MKNINTWDSLQKTLLEKENEGEFSGVVYIKQKDEVLFSGCYGYANRTFRIKPELDTRFRIASISKMFAAVALLKLCETGKVSLEDSIHTHLDLADTAISKDVTLYHLLTHTSGIGDYFDEENATDDDWYALWETKPIYTMKTLEDYYELFKNVDANFTPGEKFQYCGAGYILIGMVIEKITGQSYSDYIDELIFKKLDLRDTAYLNNEQVTENVADGYEPEYDDKDTIIGWDKNIYTMTPLPSADGGATSTVYDLVTFSRALRQGKLLSKEYTDMILTPQVIDDGSNGFRDYEWKYSFANWFILKDNKIIRGGHTGEEFGVSARLYYFPEKDIDVILLGNQGFCTGSIGWDITDIIETL